MELCFEAGKWIAWLYLSWDSIPQGCAWKWEASFKKVYSRFGQSYESRCGASVGTDKKQRERERHRERERERESLHNVLPRNMLHISSKRTLILFDRVSSCSSSVASTQDISRTSRALFELSTTPFADNAMAVVFPYGSSVIFMRCELNSTDASANHQSAKSYLAAIQTIICPEILITTCWPVSYCRSTQRKTLQSTFRIYIY